MLAPASLSRAAVRAVSAAASERPWTPSRTGTERSLKASVRAEAVSQARHVVV